jgi:TPR repeat protein
MDWHLKAGNQGNPTTTTQYNVGVFYHHGRGVPQDFKQAMAWYLKAAKQGDAGSQYNIGTLYRNGHCVLQDYTMAAEWFQNAADQGNVDAKLVLDCLSEEQAIA